MSVRNAQPDPDAREYMRTSFPVSTPEAFPARSSGGTASSSSSNTGEQANKANKVPSPHASSEPTMATVVFGMVLYSLAASGMMIVNKMVMHRAPLPSTFSTVQFASAVITVQVLGRTDCCVSACPRSDVELRCSRFLPYLKHSILFVACIYCNMQALRHTSIETIIVFRASTPIVVSMLDRAFLGREWPSLRSMMALTVLACAAASYVVNDHAFRMGGFGAYTWVSLYFATISLEMAYAKHVIGSVQFDSLWGPVLHNNLAAMPVMALLGISAGELAVLPKTTWDSHLLSRLALSCAVSVAIAYTGWNCRKLVSASCFTVLGVGNKLLTVLVNNLIWKQSASTLGNVCLFVCLLAAVSYQQAPMRSEAVTKAREPSSSKLPSACAAFVLGSLVTLLGTVEMPGIVKSPGIATTMLSSMVHSGSEVAAASSDCSHRAISPDADGPPPCPRQARPNEHVDSPAVSFVIQTFKDSALNAMQLVGRIRPIPLTKDIIVNDDSHGTQSEIWLRLLKGANEFYVSSPNLHEPRAYNRLSRYARGELLIFVQGDCCLPLSSSWMMNAVQLFQSMPRLAMLSARAGYHTVPTAQMSPTARNKIAKGSAPYSPIGHALQIDQKASITGSKAKTIPFSFATGVDNGPLMYRREALLKVGGFDESYSCRAGHVAVHYDFEVGVRFWNAGFQVGVYYGGSSDGLGGQKSMRRLPLRRKRYENEEWNARRILRLLRKHNASIAQKMLEATQVQLVPIPIGRQEEMRMREEAVLGKLPSDERCFQGILTNTSFKDVPLSRKVVVKKPSAAKIATGKRRQRATKQFSKKA